MFINKDLVMSKVNPMIQKHVPLLVPPAVDTVWLSELLDMKHADYLNLLRPAGQTVPLWCPG